MHSILVSKCVTPSFWRLCRLLFAEYALLLLAACLVSMPKASRKAAADVDMPEAPAGEPGDSAPPLDAVAPMPLFPALTASEALGGKVEWRKVAVPAHRLTPLKESWMDLYTPVTEHMKVDMRMNLKTRKARSTTGWMLQLAWLGLVGA